MKIKKIYLLMAALMLLEGCAYTDKIIGPFKAQFTKMEEPVDGDRARVRVISSTYKVRATVGSDCIDWKRTASVLGGFSDTHDYDGRIIPGMPDPNSHRNKKRFAEFYVRANEPITLIQVQTPGYTAICFLAATFVPEKNHDYDFTADSEWIVDGYEKQCSIMISDITDGNSTPIKIEEAKECR
ncbi:hypothetical protein [Cardiobacterium hominis]|jgi:hypothetical protein|uniref:Lipoprotein n=1 Tax=Cardiobacterium hominis (strain ATCC 15826 / DSM 8339 / NCTC 10426 / 6573) TaxID=638300 RepID=C8N9P8_CARH6|nr:hypothetical protein [Cardiobacterium hominis]EEV88619.1 hypothetical protein HMPREF0198_1226 [Cardiobacterium hominis ATCC 15826]VEG76251.1 Uncharacterised protein [Cardiobacterium hominis]